MLSTRLELTLQWMISPTDCASFYDSWWNRKPLRVTRNDPGYYSPLLSEADLEYLIHSAVKIPGAVEELVDGTRPRRLRNHYGAVASFRSGKSLRVDGTQRFSRTSMLLCRALEQEFSCPINVNLYLTPGQTGARALDRHFDTHDVFVLQIYGRKKWRVYDSPIPFPLEYLPPIRGERHGRVRRQVEKRKQSAIKETCQVKDEFTLGAGDMHYMPRGYWHEAEGISQHPSCHLTVGVQSFTYLDLLTIAATQAAGRFEELRKPLPVGFGTHADARPAVRDQVMKIMDSLQLQINSDDALEQVANIFVSSREAVDRALLETPANLRVDHIGLASSVRYRDGVICRVSLADSRVSLCFGEVALTMPSAFEEACRFIARTRSLSAGELPGKITDDERVSLIQRLITDGLLVTVEPTINAEREPDRSLRGWVPTKITLRRKQSMVEWIHFRREPLTEPFFKQTVRRIRTAIPATEIKTTSLKALTHFEDEILPSGFIFHISRCGSTLVSNAMKTIPGTVVISEAQPFGALLAPGHEKATNLNKWEAKKVELLKALVRAYGQKRIGTEKALVIKFSSWDILSLAILRRLWPKVPSLVVIRDPVEVMVSCISKPPGWMRLKQSPNVASRMFGWTENEINEMSEERFCARGIAEFLRAGATIVGEFGRVVSYENLRPSCVGKIASFFGFNESQLDHDSIDKVFGTYSKDALGKQSFVSDTDKKQTSSTNTMRNECTRWAKEPYVNLKQKEGW
jgi:ribosomal protein L16 Arg81 hydroxylase